MARTEFAKMPNGEAALRKYARYKKEALSCLSEEASLSLFSDSSIMEGNEGFVSDGNNADVDFGLDDIIGEEARSEVIECETEPRKSKRVNAKHIFSNPMFLYVY